MNTFTYKDGVPKLVVDGTVVSNKYIIDPVYMRISSDGKPTIRLEVLLDEVSIDELLPIVNKYSDDDTMALGQCPTCKQTVDVDTHECKEN